MKLLHTKEEIEKFDKMACLAEDLHITAEQYSKLFNTKPLENISKKYKKEVDDELAKYNYLIGVKATAPASLYTSSTLRREGFIEKITHFNIFSNSVRCQFRYENGDYDWHAIKDLELIR